MAGTKKWPSRTDDLEREERRRSWINYIVGPRRTSDNAYIHNDVKTWDNPIYAVVQEDEAKNRSPEK